MLYVCNAGDGNEVKPSVESINLAIDSTITTTTSLLSSPSAIAVAWPHVFVLDQGSTNVTPGVRRLSSNGTITTTTNTNLKPQNTSLKSNTMCIGGTKMYLCGISTSGTAVCDVYDLQTGTRSTFATDLVGTPCLVGADPVTEHVFVATQQADSQNATVTEYNARGTKLNTYETGINPKAFVFDVGIKYEEY
jgi:hypothetical protein